MERVKEGKLPEAERLLAAARVQMGSVVNIEFDGKRVGKWYSEASEALLKAKRSEQVSGARVQSVIDSIRGKQSGR